MCNVKVVGFELSTTCVEYFKPPPAACPKKTLIRITSSNINENVVVVYLDEVVDAVNGTKGADSEQATVHSCEVE